MRFVQDRTTSPPWPPCFLVHAASFQCSLCLLCSRRFIRELTDQLKPEGPYVTVKGLEPSNYTLLVKNESTGYQTFTIKYVSILVYHPPFADNSQ